MKALLVLLFVTLTGCASSQRIVDIERTYELFVAECTLMQGHLYVPHRRVWNAPPMVWEMLDAVCWYDDGTLQHTMEDI